MRSSLEEIIAYKNPAVVRRFQKEHPEKSDRAEEIFTDLMRFFWGSKRHDQDRALRPSETGLDFFYIMDEDMREIDQMWHVFLLYTRDYADFCQRHFGEYLHHQPDLVPLFEKKGFEFASNLRKFLDYNYDLLGEAVLRRWFSDSLA